MSIRLLSPTDFIYSDDDNDRSKSLTRITTDCSSRRQTASASPFVRGVDQVVRNLRSNTYLSSFHESDRTDSGFTGDSVSTCHFTRIYHPSFKHTHQDLRSSADECLDSPLSTGIHDYLTKKSSFRHMRLEKTGWLHIKHWLTVQPSSGRVDLASKRQWKHFWIHLKGNQLQLFANHTDSQPRLTINVSDSLCYPLAEHPHRRHVFSLTTSMGDSYYLQSTDQADVENWIRSIHLQSLSMRDEDNLKYDIEQLKQKSEREHQIVKLARLQLKLIRNEKTRLLIIKQIQTWENNVESFDMDTFRYKCYLAAFSNHRHLPNAQDLLSCVTPITKSTLNKIMAFTPCGIYSCIIARRQWEFQQTKLSVEGDSSLNIKTTISIQKTSTIADLLIYITSKFNLQIDDYFVYLGSSNDAFFVPNVKDRVDHLTFSTVFIGRKLVYQISFPRSFHSSGIKLVYDQTSRLVISHVPREYRNAEFDIREEDEIIMIDDLRITNIDLRSLKDHLNKVPLVLTLRSARLDTDRWKQKSPTENMLHRDRVSTGKFFTDEQRLEKVIDELIQTERSYIQDLEHLVTQYIQPLCENETILPEIISQSLYRSVQSIHEFHETLLQHLEFSRSSEFNLLPLAKDFIHNSNKFKLYSTYCAMHLRLNRLLDPHQQNNELLKQYLIEKNPSQQHSSSFESYLIKPVQRLVKYPMFLQQMLNYSKNSSIDCVKMLRKATKTMIKIGKYINSMQELYEEHGRSFEWIIENYYAEKQIKLELNLPDLCVYGEVDWTNADLFITGKHRKKPLKTFCFVFLNGCVLIARDSSDIKSQTDVNDGKNKNVGSDRFLRFIPLDELDAEFVNSDNEHKQCWRLIRYNRTNNERIYFLLKNKDAQIYVSTIKNCISNTIDQRCRTFDVYRSLAITTDQTNHPRNRFPSSHHPRSTSNSEDIMAFCHGRSPSPIWKRRNPQIKQRNSSTINTRKLD